MKRIVLLTITAILILCTFTGCIVIPLHKRFKIDASAVASIEIYDLCESTDTLYGNFHKTESPVYEIPQDKIAEFLNDLAEIRFSDSIVITIAAIDPSFYYDLWTVRINYTDGSYELISCDGYGATYDQNGKRTESHHWGCDNEEWREFIEKHIPRDIFEHLHKKA